MRILILTVVGWTLIGAGALAQQGAQGQGGQGAAGGQVAPPVFKSTKEKGSYGIGLSIGSNMKRSGLEIDIAALARGIADALSGGQPALSQEEIQASITALQQESNAKQAEVKKQVGEKNKQDAVAFFAQNKAKPGVQSLPSGLQFKVLKAGQGASPKAADKVTTHYKGTLLDGKVFDSSYDRGEPASFGVNEVIAGWTEALQKMKVGDKWQLFIPSELGYGERGTPGGEIGPHATLVFEIELLAIEPAK